jgi:hypothetical protein
VPVIGTANAESPSALAGLFTVKVADRGKGQRPGVTPPSAGDGIHGQACCGEKEIVIVQLCWGCKSKEEPDGFAHVSCEEKFGRPLKSLNPKGLGAPDCGLNERDRPESVVGALFVRVILCVVAGEPSACAGKISAAGVIRIGCVQVGAPPTARQTFPISPSRIPPGQEEVVTPYPFAPCKTAPEPPTAVSKVTADGLERPAAAPICPTFCPEGEMICRMTELPLTCPFTDAVIRQE